MLDDAFAARDVRGAEKLRIYERKIALDELKAHQEVQLRREQAERDTQLQRDKIASEERIALAHQKHQFETEEKLLQLEMELQKYKYASGDQRGKD